MTQAKRAGGLTSKETSQTSLSKALRAVDQAFDFSAYSIIPPQTRTFCAWRQEERKGRTTKVPYYRMGVTARSNDSSTYLDWQAALELATNDHFAANAIGDMMGVGVFLGNTACEGLVLAGIDLDTCFVDGELTDWALDTIDAINSFTEVSPSHTGIKTFFLLPHDSAARIQSVTGGSGCTFKQAGSNHPPGIELYLSGRYFTMTGIPWLDSEKTIRVADFNSVMRVVQSIGPRLKSGKCAKPSKPPLESQITCTSNPKPVYIEEELDGYLKKWPKFERLLYGDFSDLQDRSASCVAWNLGGFLKEFGLSKEETRSFFREYPHLDLAKYTENDRQFDRIWDKVREQNAMGKPSNEIDVGRSLPELPINKSNLAEAGKRVAELLSNRDNLFHLNGPIEIFRPKQSQKWEAKPLKYLGIIRLAQELVQPVIAIEKPNGDVVFKPCSLPKVVAQHALENSAAWRLRPFAGFSSTPLINDDGSIHSEEGYDALSQMFCANIPQLDVPSSPSLEDAQAALVKIRELLQTFPFSGSPTITDHQGVTKIDIRQPPESNESAAICAFLTAAIRSSLQLAPAFVVTAPTLSGSGAGKGTLVHTICAATIGLRPSAISPGLSKEELDKRICGALLHAEQVLFLDNFNNSVLQNPTLESIITENPAKLRPLGTSEMIEISTRPLVVVTGNGLSIGGDMARRTLHVHLDPGTEDAESRVFLNDPKKDATNRRAEFLTAALTIGRWGLQCPDLKRGRAIGSFGEWARFVRDPLINLGCTDPANRIAQTKASDPTRMVTAEFFFKWYEKHGSKFISISQIDPEVSSIIEPHNRSRQYLTGLVQKYVDTRAGGFTLVKSPSLGKSTGALYAVKKAGGDTLA